MSVSAVPDSPLNLAWENPEPVSVTQDVPVFLAECDDGDKAHRIVSNLPTGWLLIRCSGPRLHYEIFVGSLRKPNSPEWLGDESV